MDSLVKPRVKLVMKLVNAPSGRDCGNVLLDADQKDSSENADGFQDDRFGQAKLKHWFK